VKKRILHVEGNEDGTIGGSHKILADLVTHLSDPWEPVVLFYQTNPWVETLSAAGVEVHTWDGERREEAGILGSGGKFATLRGLWTSIRRRADFIRSHGIDVVLLNNSHKHGVDEWVPAARLARVPCTSYSMGGPGREPSLVRRFLIRQLDHVFPLSELMLRGVLTNGYPESRMTLVYPGLDLEAMDAYAPRPATEVRSEFGLRPDQLLAVMTGNLRHWKGQHVVVEGLGHLGPEHRSRIRMVFVGDTRGHEEYTDSVRNRVAELGLEEVVTFAGWRTDVPDLLEAADIGVHSSVLAEPFGLVVLEAMAHGCATVAADEGGPVEMIDPGRSGLTFDTERPETLAAHLAYLIDDEAARLEMARVARQEARKFDLDRHVGLLTGALERLV
jgi:glycosyltransferase involved in cell wall biosynthesis